MKISNIRVYGLEESILASGYPMATEIEEYNEVKVLLSSKDLERAARLAGASPGSGHDCMLKGIVVQADITAPQYWWLQFGRYHVKCTELLK